MLKKLLSIAFLACAVVGVAQTRYAIRQIDFQDNVNSEMVRPHTDNLAVVLVDAYLNNKLPAYKVGPLDSLIQGLEFQKRSLRETQTPQKKKLFERKNKKSFGKGKTNIQISPADLQPLTKSEFLQQMVILEDEVTQWDKSTRYERGKGLIYYKGLGYFPKKDTLGIPPPN